MWCIQTHRQAGGTRDKYRSRNLHWAECIIIDPQCNTPSVPARPPAGNPQIGYLCFGILSISSRCCYWECEEFLDDSWNRQEIMGVPRIVKSNLFSQSAQAKREKSQSFIRQLDPGLAKKAHDAWMDIDKNAPVGPLYLFLGSIMNAAASACSTAAINVRTAVPRERLLQHLISWPFPVIHIQLKTKKKAQSKDLATSHVVRTPSNFHEIAQKQDRTCFPLI